MTERSILVSGPILPPWIEDEAAIQPYAFKIRPWNLDRARFEFLALFAALTGGAA